MRKIFLLLAAGGLLLSLARAQEIGVPTGATRKPVALNQSCSGSDKMVGIDSSGNIVCAADQTGSGGSVPPGTVVLIVSGSCSATLGSGWSEETTLSGKFVLGTAAANTDIGSTGGSDSVTPAGTVSQPTFTGSSNQSTSANSAGTPAGTVSQPTLTMNPYTPAGSVGSIAATPDAGVKVGTSGTNAAALAHTHAAPGFTGTPATLTGTVSQPSFTGSALAAHSHTLTPSGSVSQPTFTGTAQDNRPAFVKVIFCRKN